MKLSWHRPACLHILCLLFSPCLLAEAVPGGISLVDLSTESRPVAWYEGKRVLIMGKDRNWQAVVGIALDSTAGTHKLEVEADGIKMRKTFEVKNKEYQSQHITIKDKRKVNPTALDMERINRDKDAIQQARISWSDNKLDTYRLVLPVQGRLSSPFGLRRFFNKQARKPHSGLDIAAPLGTPIASAGKGKVIATGDYFFNGRTVFIDHGQGLITMYCHMDRIDVQAGQDINAAEVIGSVGKSGRVTGAHLHWSVMLNQVMVDPTLFIEDDMSVE